MHSFVVAKHLDRGPRTGQWTANMVARITLSPSDLVGPPSPASATSPSAARSQPERLDAPTQLCRWPINVPYMRYEPIPEAVLSEQDQNDKLDPSLWTEWPPQERSNPSTSFAESMEQSIANGTFSTTAPEDLPISTEAISQSIQHDTELLEIDAWKLLLWRAIQIFWTT